MARPRGTVVEDRRQVTVLSASDALAMQQDGQVIDLGRGSALFTQGEQAGRLYVVLAGSVKLIHDWPGPRAAVIAVRGRADPFIGLSSFDRRTWTESAVALTAARLTTIDLDPLCQLLARRPSLRRAILRAAAHEWRQADSRLADLAFIDVRARVAAQMLQFAGLTGSATRGAVRVRHELTQDELAQLVGASRASVNAAMADFAHQGWLRRERRAALLVDPQALAQVARRSRLMTL